VTAGASGASEPLATVAPEPTTASATPTPEGAAPGHRCLDCGALLTGKFCSVCGQKDGPLRQGLVDLALEFFQHPLIDTKLWKSLVPLVLRPGALTEEYLAGRRTRYVRPLKLYLTVSVTFFALLALFVPEGVMKVSVGNQDFTKGLVAGLKGQRVSDEQPVEELHLPLKSLDERFQRKVKALEAPGGETLAHAVRARASEQLPKMVFLLLPLSAVLFKLFWRERYFVEHVVFSLHLHAYTFFAGMLLFPKWAPLTVAFMVWSAVYSVLAFKRVYRQGWVMTLFKVGMLTVAYTMLLSVAMLVTAFSAVLTT